MQRDKSKYSRIGILLISIFLCIFFWGSIRAGFLLPAFSYSTIILFVCYSVFYFILYNKGQSFLYNYGIPIVPWIILIILAIVLNFNNTTNYFILIPFIISISLSYFVISSYKKKQVILTLCVLTISLCLISAYVFYVLPKTFYQKGEAEDQEATFSTLQDDNLKFKDAKGNLINLKQIDAKIVFLEFGYSTCPPCIEKAPTTRKLRSAFINNKDVVFIHIVTGDGDSFSEFQAAAKKQERDFDLFLYAETKTMAKISRILSIQGFPFEKVFADNTNIFTHVGFSIAEASYYYQTRLDTFNKLLNND